MDNAHFPHHVDLEEFINDYHDKTMSASKVQKKHKISPRQYRIVVRWLIEEHYYKKKKTTCASKHIYEESEGKFVIRKKKNTYYGYYGTYDSLDKAIRVRDKLIEHDWDKKYME